MLKEQVAKRIASGAFLVLILILMEHAQRAALAKAALRYLIES